MTTNAKLPDSRHKYNSESDTAILLDDLTEIIRRYVIFSSEHEARVVALIILASYARNQDGTSLFFVSPYLYIRSGQSKCAKTRLIELLRQLVCIPSEHYHRLTEAVIFRLIATERCVLFIDEIHHLINGPEGDGIIGILNGGNFANGMTARADPKNPNGIIKYPIGGMKVFAGRDVTGSIPDETVSRTIIVDMPHVPNASRTLGYRFSMAKYQREAEPLRERCETWFVKHEHELTDTTEPDYPEALTDDRTAETWHGLMVIATLAGSRWLGYANEAIVYLACGETEDSETESEAISFDTAVKTALARAYVTVSAYENRKMPPAIPGINPADYGWSKIHRSAFRDISARYDKNTGKTTLRTADFQRFWHTVRRANNGHGVSIPDSNQILRELRAANRLAASGRGFKAPGKIWETDKSMQQIVCVDITDWIEPADEKPIRKTLNLDNPWDDK